MRSCQRMDREQELLIHRKVEDGLKEAVHALTGPREIIQAITYALLAEGKRVRPKVVLMTASLFGGIDQAFSAALAVEFFHTASLVADDLPCMDNDFFRRGKPSLHSAFSEPTALLASYALIAEGYEKLREGALQSNCLDLALKYTTQAMSVHGLTGGQFLDLSSEIKDESSLLMVLHQKTGALFELSFLLGWIYGGGDQEKLPLVQQFARSLGLIFQLEDDCEDTQQDAKNNSLNAVLILGRERVLELITKEKKKVRHLTQETHLKRLFEKVALYFS